MEKVRPACPLAVAVAEWSGATFLEGDSIAVHNPVCEPLCYGVKYVENSAETQGGAHGSLYASVFTWSHGGG